jgi:glycosyl transferase family 10 (putative fucosyltransferase)
VKRVLVRPTFQDWCANRLFTEGTSWQNLYRSAFAAWKQKALALGVQIDTWDQAPLESCDVFWLIDLPTSRKQFEQIRSRLPRSTPIVLQILESPAIAPFGLVPDNRELVSAVVTYELANGSPAISKCFDYHLPVRVVCPVKNPHFSERRGLLMCYSNRVSGFWAIRQLGLAGLPFFGRMLAGWKCPLSLLRELSRGDLYAERRAIAREAEVCAPGFLDVFGPGWNGEQISWCPLYRNRPYRCWRGNANTSKHELSAEYRFVMAYENFRGRRGYISEKIFDALQAGSVPVYLGEERIAEFVPRKAFVDARNFRTGRELLTYLQSCPEPEWKEMRHAGQEFLRSSGFDPFTDDAFAERMTDVLRELLSSH